MSGCLNRYRRSHYRQGRLPAANTNSAYTKPSLAVILRHAERPRDAGRLALCRGWRSRVGLGALRLKSRSESQWRRLHPRFARELLFPTHGGTSASSPAFAGVLALVTDQLQGGSGSGNVRLGQVDYILYPLSKQYPQTFHDVMTGNNSVYCLWRSELRCKWFSHRLQRIRLRSGYRARQLGRDAAMPAELVKRHLQTNEHFSHCEWLH